MRRLSLLLLACSLFPAYADPIPTISITSANGQVTENAGLVVASLSGPDFTLNFDELEPNADNNALAMLAFESLPGSTENFGLTLMSFQGISMLMPTGTISVGGIIYTVTYGITPVGVQSLQPVTVPSGSVTVEVPATFGGSAEACVPAESPFGLECTAAGAVPVADVNFDIPGTLTISFAPAINNPPEEAFTEVFTPVPEPSTVTLVLVTVALLAGSLCARRMRRFQPEAQRIGPASRRQRAIAM
jgi:hypothetical protein